MKDLRKIKFGITHNGKFHLDDVMSTAFIKYFNPNLEVIRTLEYQEAPKEDEIIYDIGFGELNHHQEIRKLDDNGHPYCAFGLLWETYGKEYLKEFGFKNIDEAFALFKKKYVYKIDEGDNEGYKNLRNFSENNMVISCNPLWFENSESEIENKQFDKAVKIGIMFLENWTRKIFKEIEDHIFFS